MKRDDLEAAKKRYEALAEAVTAAGCTIEFKDGQVAVMAAGAYPATLTPELDDALGQMCFVTCPMAHAFQAAGHAIPKKTEREQAFILDKMIRAVIAHGVDWKKAFGDELGAAIDTARQRAAEKAPAA